MKKMSEPVIYSLILRSYDVSGNNTDIIDNSNITYTQNINSFFQKIATVHQCNAAKLELVSVLFNTGEILAGDNIHIDGLPLLSTQYNSINSSLPNYTCVGTVVNYDTTLVMGNAKLISSNPMYITNLGSISYLRIYFSDALSNTYFGTQFGYQLTFHITPLPN